MLNLSLPATSVTADLAKRRIRGRAVPWNVDAAVSTGQRVRFLPGSLDLSGAPVVLHHDESQPIGRVEDSTSDDSGADVTAMVSDVPEGDRALVLASDGVLTGWSVGVDPTEHTMDGEVMVISAGSVRHLALVTVPAYAEARVAQVAAAADEAQLTELANALSGVVDQVRSLISPEEPPGEETPTDETPMEGPTEMTATETPATPAEAQAAPVTVAAAPRRAFATAPVGITPGQWLHAHLNRRDNPTAAAAADAAIAAAGTTTPDVPGILPEPIVGDLISSRASSRPILEAFGPLAGPSAGKTFTRPVITDPILDAATAAELGDVTDTLGVTDISVTYSYVKRAAQLSAESIAFTSPGVLDAVLADLARAYARGTEKVAAAALEGGTYDSVTIAADGSDAVSVLYDAAAAIYGAVGTHPTDLVVSPDRWAAFGGLVDSDGRPLFPVMGASNAPGDSGGVTAFQVNVLGLRLVVSWALSPGSAYLAARDFVETYEAHRGNLRADNPTVMGVDVGIGGAAALVVTDEGAVNEITVADPV